MDIIQLTPIDRHGDRLKREPFIWRMPDGCTRIGWHNFFVMLFWNAPFVSVESSCMGQRFYGISVRFFGCRPVSIVKFLIPSAQENLMNDTEVRWRNIPVAGSQSFDVVPTVGREHMQSDECWCKPVREEETYKGISFFSRTHNLES